MASRVENCWFGGTFAVLRLVLTIKTLLRSNPISRVASLAKLRRNKPAATNKTSESATCEATIQCRKRDGWPLAMAWPPFIAEAKDTRVARRAGNKPNRTLVKTAIARVNPRTRLSSERSRNTAFLAVEM